jgi:hypothetical protein
MLLGILLFSFEFFILSSLTFYVGMIQNPDTAIELSYNAIYYYSKSQILCNNIKKQVVTFIKNDPILNMILVKLNKKIFENDIEIVKNGNIVLSINKEKILSDPSIVPNDYDLIIYTDYTNLDKNNNVLYKRIFKTIPKNLDELECEKVDYKFIMMEININNNVIPVELSNQKYNYLIANNKLDKQFILYYLKKYVCNKSEYLSDYIIKYIDHNVNMGEIDNTHIIIINKNNAFFEKIIE